MKKFSSLLENIIFSPSRTKKIKLIVDYFQSTSDPDRGYALAILTSNLKLFKIKNNEIKKIVYSKVDEQLFNISYDYIGDTAETISLIWRNNKISKNFTCPNLNHLIQKIKKCKKEDLEIYITNLLDGFNPKERWTLIKILTGGLRIGISERLTKIALAKYGNKNIELIEKIWHGLKPPYESLFAWLDNKNNIPSIDNLKTFHPMMLAHPINEEKDFKTLDARQFLAEWKWDGIRVQIIISKNKTVIFSRTGEEISHSFPDINFSSKDNVVIDGELLVGRNCIPETFNDLQQRLNRKNVSKEKIKLHPAFVKAYDILFFNDQDQRNKDFVIRRKILESWFKENKQKNLDISSMILFDSWEQLKEIKISSTRKNFKHEGIMLKLKKSKYLSGRPKGFWFKWKRNPRFIEAILMYAQRGHGKRSSFYSDFTFGVWHENNIVPIGKAYTGFTNEELNELDKFVRKNTINRFGPVREVEKKLVFEVAFDSVFMSSRHKSGLALRFPRISRIRWDKPTNEVENLSSIKKMYNLDEEDKF